MNQNDYLSNEMISIDKEKLGKNNLIFDVSFKNDTSSLRMPKDLPPKVKTDKEKLKEFVYCMKMMALTQQGFNLINYSKWGKEKGH